MSIQDGNLSDRERLLMTEMGCVLLLMERLGISAKAVRDTALSRARAHLDSPEDPANGFDREVRCEHCGVVGLRRRGTISPEGWLFQESRTEGSGEILITQACCEAHALALWRKGPGCLDLTWSEGQPVYKDETARPAFKEAPGV